MFKFKSLVFLSAIIIYEIAALPRDSATIPVKVIYEQPNKPSSNLDRHYVSIPKGGNSKGVRNLDEKVQLSSDQLKEADSFAQSALKLGEGVENSSPAPLTPQEEISTSENPLSPNENPNVALFIQIAQQIIYSGLETIRNNVEQLAASQPGEPTISEAQWDNFNKSIQHFFAALSEQEVRNEPDTETCQKVLSGFKDASSSFIKDLKQENRPPQIGQNIINAVSSGFSQIGQNLGNALNRATTQSTVLGDAPAPPSQPSNPFQGIFQQVVSVGQNFFSPGSAPPGGAQGDEPQNQNPFQAFQGVVQQAVNNFAQAFNQGTPAPGAQGDQPPANNNPLQAFQSVVQQAVNNFQQTFAQATPSPGGQSDTPQNQNPFQVFQGVVQQAVNNFQQQFSGSTPPPGTQGDSPPNPFQNFQAVIQQAVNNFQQSLQGQNTPAPGAQGDTPQQGPFQQIQNAFGQVFNFNNPLQNATAIPSGNPSIEGLVEAGQNQLGQITQVGAAIGSPIQNGTAGFNPNDQISNVVGQIGGVINNNNPLQNTTGGATNLRYDSVEEIMVEAE